MNRYVAALTLFSLAACAPKPETAEQLAARMKAESDSARTAIAAANARWVRYMAVGKPDSAALNFAEDAVLMLANEPVIAGRTAIQAKFAELLSYGTWQANLFTTSLVANGPVAVEQATNIVRFTPGPRAPAGMAAMTDTLKGLTYWKKVNGTWLEAADIAVSIRSAPMPPSATKRH